MFAWLIDVEFDRREISCQNFESDKRISTPSFINVPRRFSRAQDRERQIFDYDRYVILMRLLYSTGFSFPLSLSLLYIDSNVVDILFSLPFR